MTTVEIRARYLAADGTPATGRVVFTPRVAAVAGAETIQVAEKVVADLDGTGALAVDLQATDDPALTPVDWTYRVVEQVRGTGERTYDIEVPVAAAGAGIDLVEVAPAAASVGAASAFVTLTAHATEQAARAAGDAANAAAILTIPPIALPAMTQPVRSLITAFQSGHGWTASNLGASTNLNDTTDVALGAQSLKAVTTTTNTSGTVASGTLTAFDASSKSIKLLLKVEGLANLADLRFYAGDSTLANAKNWNLGPVEADGSSVNTLKEGEWTWVTYVWDHGSNIGTPANVRAAITKYQLRAQAVNGQAMTVHLGAVAWVPDGTSIFPNGAVSFTYDDGRLSGLSYGRLKLDQYGWAGTAYPIVDRVGLATYATVAQLKAARDLSGWEIACHSYTQASHNAGYTTLTPAQVQDELRSNRRWLIDNALGDGVGFAWPRGMSSRTLEDAASAVVAYGRANVTSSFETLPPPMPMRVRSISVGAATSLATLQGLVDKAKAGRGWLIVTFHDIVTSGATGSEVNLSVHDGLADYVAAQGLTVLPVAEVARRLA